MSLVVVTVFLGGCHGNHPKTMDSPETMATESDAVSADEMTVEVGCGDCIYDMPGLKGCPLAAKIDGTPMLVTGVKVNAHKLGLCKKAKEAVVVGHVEGDKFVATKVEVEE